MSIPTALQAVLATRAQEARRAADPLATFEWPSAKHARWARAIGERIESSLRAANFGAKTYSGAAMGLAMAEGKRELDGVRLPVVPIPNVGAILVPSHAQQIDSSQAAIAHWLGEWPHEFSWIASNERKASGLHVKTARCGVHGHNASCRYCSRIRFYSHESPQSVLGARWDWAWFDEPYDPAMWQEMRKNAPYRFGTWTPLAQSAWEPLERDFGDSTGEPKHGRLQVIATLDDNKFLSAEKKRELRESYRGDPFARARESGELMDVEGATPWGDLGLARLQEMLTRCQEPDLYEFPLAAAHRSAEKSALVEVSFEPEDDECYYLDLDGSMGISDEDGARDEKLKKHRDPGAFHLYARRRPRLVACHSGYLTPQVLGRLAAKVAKRYKHVQCDAEDQGGYGEAAMIGMREEGGVKFAASDRREVRGGGNERRYGFKTDAVTRGLYIGAVQDQILHGGIEIRNAALIRSALGMRVDKNGKLLARYGMHDEHVILWGRAAHWLALPANAPEPLRASEAAQPSTLAQFMAKERGRSRANDWRAQRADNWIEP